MIATATLKSLVASYLKISSTDYDRFEVENNLNAAQRHLLSVLPSHMISEAVTNRLGNLVANKRFYQYASNHIRLLRLWFDYENAISETNPGRQARIENDPGTIESFWSMPTTLYPVAGAQVEGGFEVFPIPTANVTHGWKIQYIQMLPTLSDTQDCLMSSQFTNLLVFYATMLSASVEGAFPDIASEMRQLYKDELEMFIPKVEKV